MNRIQENNNLSFWELNAATAKRDLTIKKIAVTLIEPIPKLVKIF